MYTLIGGANNRTFRVVWMLEELGLPYQRQFAQPHDPLVSAHSPLGKLPVLLAEGEALTDSVAILTWLADSTGRMTARAGTLARAKQDGLTQQIVDEIEGPLWTSTRHSFVLPAEHRVPAVKDSLRWEFARSCEVLAARMAGPFVMGEEITVPDILLAHCLGWAQVAKFPLETPALLAFAERLRGRDAFRRAMASDRAIMAQCQE